MLLFIVISEGEFRPISPIQRERERFGNVDGGENLLETGQMIERERKKQRERERKRKKQKEREKEKE